MRLLRVTLFLLLAGFAGLAAYAYFGDMAADPQTMRVPVELDLGGTAAAPAAAAAAAESATAEAADPAPAAARPPASNGPGADGGLD